MAAKKRKVVKKVKKVGKKKKVVASKKAVAPKKRRRVGKIQNAKKNVFQRLEQVNRVINRFEGEVEGIVKKLVKQGEKSRKEIRKNFDGIFTRLRKGEFITKASETRDDVEREVRRLADEVIGTIKEVETLFRGDKVAGLFHNARTGIGTLVELLSDNVVVHQAINAMSNTRKEVLGLLSIPTQSEVEKLERKIVSLERRLSNLSRKAA